MVLNLLHSATSKVKFSFNLTLGNPNNFWVDIHYGRY